MDKRMSVAGFKKAFEKMLEENEGRGYLMTALKCVNDTPEGKWMQDAVSDYEKHEERVQKVYACLLADGHFNEKDDNTVECKDGMIQELLGVKAEWSNTILKMLPEKYQKMYKKLKREKAIVRVTGDDELELDWEVK